MWIGLNKENKHAILIKILKLNEYLNLFGGYSLVLLGKAC